MAASRWSSSRALLILIATSIAVNSLAFNNRAPHLGLAPVWCPDERTLDRLRSARVDAMRLLNERANIFFAFAETNVVHPTRVWIRDQIELSQRLDLLLDKELLPSPTAVKTESSEPHLRFSHAFYRVKEQDTVLQIRVSKAAKTARTLTLEERLCWIKQRLIDFERSFRTTASRLALEARLTWASKAPPRLRRWILQARTYWSMHIWPQHQLVIGAGLGMFLAPFAGLVIPGLVLVYGFVGLRSRIKRGDLSLGESKRGRRKSCFASPPGLFDIRGGAIPHNSITGGFAPENVSLSRVHPMHGPSPFAPGNSSTALVNSSPEEIQEATDVSLWSGELSVSDSHQTFNLFLLTYVFRTLRALQSRPRQFFETVKNSRQNKVGPTIKALFDLIQRIWLERLSTQGRVAVGAAAGAVAAPLAVPLVLPVLPFAVFVLCLSKLSSSVEVKRAPSLYDIRGGGINIFSHRKLTALALTPKSAAPRSQPVPSNVPTVETPTLEEDLKVVGTSIWRNTKSFFNARVKPILKDPKGRIVTPTKEWIHNKAQEARNQQHGALLPPVHSKSVEKPITNAPRKRSKKVIPAIIRLPLIAWLLSEALEFVGFLEEDKEAVEARGRLRQRVKDASLRARNKAKLTWKTKAEPRFVQFQSRCKQRWQQGHTEQALWHPATWKDRDVLVSSWHRHVPPKGQFAFGACGGLAISPFLSSVLPPVFLAYGLAELHSGVGLNLGNHFGRWGHTADGALTKLRRRVRRVLHSLTKSASYVQTTTNETFETLDDDSDDEQEIPLARRIAWFPSSAQEDGTTSPAQPISQTEEPPRSFWSLALRQGIAIGGLVGAVLTHSGGGGLSDDADQSDKYGYPHYHHDVFTEAGY